MLTHTHATFTFAFDDRIFIADLWAPRAPQGTHRVTRNSSLAAQKILLPSQSICQVVYPVCNPAAISAGLSLSSGLPQTGYFPTQYSATMQHSIASGIILYSIIYCSHYTNLTWEFTKKLIVTRDHWQTAVYQQVGVL